MIAFKGPLLKHATPCITKEIKLMGGEGYHELLHVQLVQKYGISQDIAKHLCATYGSVSSAISVPDGEREGRTEGLATTAALCTRPPRTRTHPALLSASASASGVRVGVCGAVRVRRVRADEADPAHNLQGGPLHVRLQLDGQPDCPELPVHRG